MPDEQIRRLELLASMASMYYLDGLDQNAIATKVGLSRSTVSRMITEARQAGVVRIRIDRPLPRDEVLEQRVRTAFGLREALIVAEPAPGVQTSSLSRVGALAAQHLERVLPDHGALAISWGTSVAAVAEALDGDAVKHVRIIQMLGASGSRHPTIDGPELARVFADRLGGAYRTLNAPLVLDDDDLVQALLRQTAVADVLAEARRADVALIGLGGMHPDVSSLLRAGFATAADLEDSVREGAVGDAGGHMLRADGSTVATRLSRRMLRLDEASLRAVPEVVAVAVGSAKTAIITAALASGIVDVIASDAPTMRAVLKATAKEAAHAAREGGAA